MDPYSSGEDLVIKTRKPYTITKQRERWTEQEHNRFLEALKLYGRAWQRIEEHIGTKTAVQIRSHAQKFFTKLEKEAIVKGVPIGHALDIEIPPPRPKRKPSNPYPRKTSLGAPTSQVGVKNGNIPSPGSSSCQSQMTGALEKEAEEPYIDGKLGNSKVNEYPGKDNDSEAFTLVNTAPCANPTSDDAPRISRTFRQYVPLSKEAINHDETAAASQVTVEAKGSQTNNASFNITNIVDSYFPHEKSMHNNRISELTQSEYVQKLSTAADVQASQNYPRHVPVHILDGSLGMSAQNAAAPECKFHLMGGVINPAISEHYTNNASRSCVHQSFSSYHPPIFTPIQNQDDYQSFQHVSSMFSSLIVSALSQNPASFGAAGFAATLWPCVNMEPSSTVSDGASFQSGSTPSMAAIAAATVAAATAWWAAHGLLPLCPPFHHTAFASPSATPLNDSSQDRAVVNSERRENSPDPALGGQQLEPECSEAALHSVSKSTVLSSSESEDAKLDVGLAEASETAKGADTIEKNKKLVDRSSCGSNTPSSSEVEAEASEKLTKGKEESHMKDKEEPQELDAVHSAGDPLNRRCRSTSNVNDSWKEVSEEGRLAFQALFSREVLPQSFSPPHDVKNKGKKISIQESAEEKDENGLQLDLNRKTWVVTCFQKQEVNDNSSLIGENKEEALLNMGHEGVKLKAHQTGFKPYKRCSLEAKDSRVSSNSHDEEKGPKRLRLEEEAST